jgi:hypothetical protein
MTISIANSSGQINSTGILRTYREKTAVVGSPVGPNPLLGGSQANDMRSLPQVVWDAESRRGNRRMRIYISLNQSNQTDQCHVHVRLTTTHDFCSDGWKDLSTKVGGRNCVHGFEPPFEYGLELSQRKVNLDPNGADIGVDVEWQGSEEYS